MAKLSRSSLKALVKECLVEILAEGIGSSSGTSRAPVTKRRRKSTVKQNVNSRRQDKLDDQTLERNINKTVSTLTEDNIMQDIFSDTAKTTLQEQAGADRLSTGPGARTPEALIAKTPGVDLGGIFDSASQNWSSLAFSENKADEHNN